MNFFKPGCQVPSFQTIDSEYFYIPKYELNDYVQVISRIMGKLPLIEPFLSDKDASINHIAYTLQHKIAIMALFYEYKGYVSKRILLHDTEKLALYTIMGTKEAHHLHRNYSIHHRENFSSADAEMLETAMTEALFDYECARYTKPDKPLNAYSTIINYFPNDYLAMEPLLKKYQLSSPENVDCKFEKWDIVSRIYMQMFEKINTKAIEMLKEVLSHERPEDVLVKYNDYLSVCRL